MRFSSVLASVVAIGALSAPMPARASDAEDLFREGVKLLDGGNVHAACEKLAQSQSLEPAAGTLLNLADCYERDGKPALALATFVRAREAAVARGRADWVRTCDGRIASLDAKVPRVTIELPSTPGLRVSMDGAPIASDALKSGVRVDVGSHTFEAAAPGYVSHWGTVDVRGSMRVRIPELAPTAKPATNATNGSAPSQNADATRRTLGIAIAGAGAAGLVFGGVAALVGKNALDEAKDKCADYPSRCSPDATGPNERAKTWTGIATGFVVAGVLLGGAGAAIALWPSASVAPDHAYVTLHARF